jgi:hypothetical protein
VPRELASPLTRQTIMTPFGDRSRKTSDTPKVKIRSNTGGFFFFKRDKKPLTKFLFDAHFCAWYHRFLMA